MGELTKGVLTDVLLELSVNDLVAIEYQLSKGKMVAEIMERDFLEVRQAIDDCGLHYQVLDKMDPDCFPTEFSTEWKFFIDIKDLIEELKDGNHAVVTTNGCFDIIHAGHVQYLEKCKDYGNFLLVLVNGNRRVKELKGPDRPFVDWEDRVAIICALEAVDAVMVFEENAPCQVLETLCKHGIIPVAHIKSGGYANLDELPEHQLLVKYGSTAHIIPPQEGCSTTSLIEKIRGGYDHAEAKEDLSEPETES